MVKIKSVVNNSISHKKGIIPGDLLVSVNGKEVCDILDYRFFVTEKELTLCLLRDGNELIIKLKKPQYDDIGLEFETYLMDEKRRCKNGCIFCFIDQNPKGMRQTIYFKDDDERLSFLFGNYITLTNLRETDVERIIAMKLSPVNVSVHTTNPELRVQMMKNKHSGEALSFLKRFSEAGIAINAQIVLCRGINDGDELERTMNDLCALFPSVQSVAIVPAGVTKHREGLEVLMPYDKDSSASVLKQVLAFGDKCVSEIGHRLFFPADEFFVLSGMQIPDEPFYEGYMQLDNGVGMLRLLREEFLFALEQEDRIIEKSRTVTVVTGKAAFAEISALSQKATDKFSDRLSINVIAIDNNFFGENITVAGLVVGGDIENQLKGKDLGDVVLIPRTMLRSEGDLFLDDMSLETLEKRLGVLIEVVENDGGALLDALTGF